MGLFVSEDGRYQGWLAALLCCWIAHPDDEPAVDKPVIPTPSTSQNTFRYRQPAPLPPIHPTALPALPRYNRSTDAVFNDPHRMTISERPPSLKPLDLGEPSLFDKMSLHSRRKSSTTLMNRISIGKPTDFRRLEYTEKQRRSLVPLQLNPVVLKRDSTFDPASTLRPTSDVSFNDMVESSSPSGPIARGTPFERCQQLTASSPGLTVNSHGLITETPKDARTDRPTLSTQSSSSSIRSLRRAGSETRLSTGSPSSRNSMERPRMRRKRSGLKASGDSADLDIDREILELNTIVEERRAETNRPSSPTDQHVPAIAPRMPVRARSETLTDIGSALSRPLVAMPVPVPMPDHAVQPPAEDASPETPIKSRLSRPFVGMPDMPVDDSAFQQHIRRPSSRVAGWLANMFSTSTPAPAGSHTHRQSLGSANHRPVSEASLCETSSEIESNTLTSSSPMSKLSHSRTMTAESQVLTPTSPQSTLNEYTDLEKSRTIVDPWPLVPDHGSQVGVAL